MRERDKQKPTPNGERWLWGFTDWSQRVLGASGVLAAGAIGAIAIGVSRKDMNFLIVGINLAAVTIPVTLILGIKEVIEADYRKRHNITRPRK